MRSFKDRITIQKITNQQQADGHIRPVPSNLLVNVPANHMTISGTEIVKRGVKIEATELAVFETRVLPSTVNTTAQVLFKGSVYGIVDIRKKESKVGDVERSLIYAKQSI